MYKYSPSCHSNCPTLTIYRDIFTRSGKVVQNGSESAPDEFHNFSVKNVPTRNV